MTEDRATALLDMTVGIIASFVSANKLPPDEIAGLISGTHAALSGLGTPDAEPAAEITRPTPAEIRKSISDGGIISFIDGRTYQSLKRHLGSNGYTPQSYRETFGLRHDYPMVSPDYAARRSALAKASGLGQGGRRPKASAKAAAKARKAKV